MASTASSCKHVGVDPLSDDGVVPVDARDDVHGIPAPSSSVTLVWRRSWSRTRRKGRLRLASRWKTVEQVSGRGGRPEASAQDEPKVLYGG
ncbi:MAG: hypothetical protein V9F04_13990 [Dermatophilaceae bacterium]